MDRTNMFFLVVAGGMGWFMWREYQKQKDAQRLMFAQQRTAAISGLGVYQSGSSIDPGRVYDYAERIASGNY